MQKASSSALPALEPSSRIISPGDLSGCLALEEGFRKYVGYWNSTPTIDSTALALHSLLVLERLQIFLGQWRGSVLRFLNDCRCEAGFALAPSLRRYPSLYASLSAIGVLKALWGVRQFDPLHGMRERLREQFLEVRAQCRKLLERCWQDGLFADSPGETPTVHSLDLGVSLCWELDLLREFSIDGESRDIHKFLDRCRVHEGGGFSPRPSTDGESHGEPCTTTTALVVRILARIETRYPTFPGTTLTKEAERFLTRERWDLGSFLTRMETNSGGLRVFPRQLPSLSATSFALTALKSLGELGWMQPRRAQLVRFVDSCRNVQDGGYGFTPSFASNVHATRYALRILKLADPLPGGPNLASAKDAASFLISCWSPQTGGFWGYYPVGVTDLVRDTRQVERGSDAQVFLSYANEDREDATRIAAFLEKAGLRVWVRSQQLTPGQNWAARIGNALESCNAMVVLLSESSARSEHVRQDIDFALSNPRYKRRLVPVIIGSADDFLDESWFLRKLEPIDLMANLERGLRAIEAAVSSKH